MIGDAEVEQHAQQDCFAPASVCRLQLNVLRTALGVQQLDCSTA